MGTLSRKLDSRLLSIAAIVVLLASYWTLGRFCGTYTAATLDRSPTYDTPAEPVCAVSDYLFFPLVFGLAALGLVAFVGAGTGSRFARGLSFLGILVTLSMTALAVVVMLFSTRLDANDPSLALTAAEERRDKKEREASSSPSDDAATAPQAGGFDADKQRQTAEDLRSMGTAMISWLTDHSTAAGVLPSAGTPQPVRLADYSTISRSELERLLVPNYLIRLPEHDGWGYPYDLRLNTAGPSAEQVLLVRSPGRDGVYSDEAGTYTPGALTPASYDEDLVWADGAFIRSF